MRLFMWDILSGGWLLHGLLIVLLRKLCKLSSLSTILRKLDMIMIVIEIRLQTLHIWITQQTLTFLMHHHQSMLLDIEKSWVKMDISLLVLRMLYRRTSNSYLIQNSWVKEDYWWLRLWKRLITSLINECFINDMHKENPIWNRKKMK